MLVKALPAYGDPALREGKKVARGAYFDATYRERDRSVACRFRLCSDIVLWPFDLRTTEYYLSAGPMQALGIPVERDALAGLGLSLTHRMAPRIEDEIADEAARTKPEFWFAGCRMDELPIYLTGAEDEAIALYEQIIGNCIGVYIRYLDDYGDPVVIKLPAGAIKQVGFEEEDSLFPIDNRVFRGSELLRVRQQLCFL